MKEDLKEVEDAEGLFLPPTVFPERRVDALRQILSGTCGRFRLPFTISERLKFKLALLTEEISLGNDSFIFHNGMIPDKWQIILKFLERNGVIKSDEIQFTRFPNGFPGCHSLGLHPSYDSSISDGRDVRYGGFGIADSFEESISKAIGEILERYFLTIHKKSACIFATSGEISKRNKSTVFPVGRFNTYLPFQTEAFSFLHSTGATKFMWVEGQELLSGSHAFIPAQKIFWTFDFNKEPAEPCLGNATTSGGGGHFTKEEAFLSSIYENIERDSFFLYWLNSLPPPRITLPKIPGEPVLDEFLAFARNYGLEVHFLDTTGNVAVPSVVSVIVDKKSAEPKICVASSTGFNPVKVILESLLEAFTVYFSTNKKEKFSLPPSYKPFITKGISRAERLMIWQGKEMCEKFSFFLSGKTESWDTFLQRGRDFVSKKDELNHTLSIFRKLGAGYEVYAYEVNHTILDTLGYHVVKTIIPKLFPLYLQEHLATLDSERLKEAPDLLDFPTSAAKLNPWPHPFP